MGKEGPTDRLEMVSMRANMGKEGPKDRLEMVSREPTWAKKAPQLDQRWLLRERLGQRRSQGETRDGFKRSPNLSKEGPKNRVEMVSREPTWAKKVPRID